MKYIVWLHNLLALLSIINKDASVMALVGTPSIIVSLIYEDGNRRNATRYRLAGNNRFLRLRPPTSNFLHVLLTKEE